MYEDVLGILRNTRSMLLPRWGNVDGLRKEASEHSLVTELDLAIEHYLASELRAIAPDVAFVGEESGGSRDQSRFWLCDPIDGTLQFARGLPFCTVQLALIEAGSVNFSAIYDFLNDVLYHAIRGGGAYQNGARIRVSDRPLERSLVILETRLYKEQRNIELARRLQDRLHLTRSAVAGYEFTLVASGKVEGRICYDPWGKDYDYVPGTLLVEEAGGIVATIGFSSYDFRSSNFIAATPEVYGVLTEGPDALFPILR